MPEKQKNCHQITHCNHTPKGAIKLKNTFTDKCARILIFEDLTTLMMLCPRQLSLFRGKFDAEEEPGEGLLYHSYKNIKYIIHFKNAKITENPEQCLDHWLGFLDVWRNSEALFK